MDVDIDRPPLEDDIMDYEEDPAHLVVAEKVEEAVMGDLPLDGDADEVMEDGIHAEGEGGMEAEPTPPLRVGKTFEASLPIPPAVVAETTTVKAEAPKADAPVLAVSNGGPTVVPNSEETVAARASPNGESSSSRPPQSPKPAEAHEIYEEEGVEYVDEAEYDHELEDEGGPEELPRIDSSTLPSIILHLPSLGSRALFALGPQEEGVADNPSKVYLEGRESILAEASLLDVWTEIRSEIVREGVNTVGEMVLEEKQMDLRMGEDDINIQATTLLEFLQVYLDCDLPTPIELHVTFQPSRFVARYNAIQKELAMQTAQRKLGAAEGEHEGDGEYEEYEEELRVGENEGTDEVIHNEAEAETEEEKGAGEDLPVTSVEKTKGHASGETRHVDPNTEDVPTDDAEISAAQLDQEAVADAQEEAAAEDVHDEPEESADAAPVASEPTNEPQESAEASEEAIVEPLEDGGDTGEEEYEEEYYEEGEEEVEGDAAEAGEDGEEADANEGEQFETLREEQAVGVKEDKEPHVEEQSEETAEADEDAEGDEGDEDEAHFDVDEFVKLVDEQDGVDANDADGVEEEEHVEEGEQEVAGAEIVEVSPQEAQQMAKGDFIAANERAEASKEDETVEDPAAALEAAEAKEENVPQGNGHAAVQHEDEYEDEACDVEENGENGDEVLEENAEVGAEAEGEYEGDHPAEEAPEDTIGSRVAKRRYAAPVDDEDEEEAPGTKKPRVEGEDA